MINGLLREDMGFNGLVMTDDLDMGAILNHYGFDETMRRGIAAGNDMLMICHRVELAARRRKFSTSFPLRKPKPRWLAWRPSKPNSLRRHRLPKSLPQCGFRNLGSPRRHSGRGAGRKA